MAAIVFMGTPQFSVPVLRSLINLASVHTIAGVVTQPDRPVGRGRRVQASAAAEFARAHGLALIQPASLRKEPAAVEQLRAWAPDVIVVAAFGQILRPEVLAIPPHGCLNVHASLLPRWRGAAPIAHAILAGDAVTGVSIMQMEAGLDSGPVLLAREEAVRPDDTTGTLTARLADLGAALLLEALPGWLAGTLAAVPQNGARATLAPMLRKEQGRLDWTRPAAALARQVRAFDPWPGTFTTWEGRVLKVLRAAAMPGAAAPGRVVARAGGLAAGSGDGLLQLIELQLEGKRAVTAAEFVRGHPAVAGALLV
jgi:methionyl-tRNA formyltransferase